MNPRLAPLFARRSVRRYTEDPVNDASLRDMLEAAMAAPSAVARDPWHFIVVRETDTLNRMADALPNGQMLRQAPVAVLVCGDLAAAHGGELSYLLQDCAAAIQNLLLAASMLGIGACWLGVHPRDNRVLKMREIFALPERIVPVSAVALGHPGEHPPARTRYRDEAVHRERW